MADTTSPRAAARTGIAMGRPAIAVVVTRIPNGNSGKLGAAILLIPTTGKVMAAIRSLASY